MINFKRRPTNILSYAFQWTVSIIFVVVLFFQKIESSQNRNSVPVSPMTTADTKVNIEEFLVYWNVPTFQCHKRGFTFDYLNDLYGIRQNKNDSFHGNKISILYDPGKFPALLSQKDKRQLYSRNGGVPQEGDLNQHISEFKTTLINLIPDKLFNGVAIIDFESWRPIFRQNFGTLKPYQDYSIEIEQRRHPLWMNIWIKNEAKKRFENDAMVFMRETLKVAKETRPLAKWGFYAYPYCFNMNGNNKQYNCPDNVVDENNRIQWLWDSSDALYPSVYMSKNTMNSNERLTMIKGRVFEAKRISSRNNMKHDIFPYLWYKYRDETDKFLARMDLENALYYMKNSKLNGVIIWGSSNDVNTKEKCQLLDNYVKNILGPTIRTIIPNGSHRIIAIEMQKNTSRMENETGPKTVELV